VVPVPVPHSLPANHIARHPVSIRFQLLRPLSSPRSALAGFRLLPALICTGRLYRNSLPLHITPPSLPTWSVRQPPSRLGHVSPSSVTVHPHNLSPSPWAPT
jgi:hypothetical protein